MKCGVQHWNCEICKRYNDVLNIHCVFCKALKPDWITAKYQLRVELERGIFMQHGVLASHYTAWEGRVNKKYMTPNEELHAKFFSEEAVLVQGMEDADLDEHIHELETIAREAKARILAATEEKRTRKAKQGNKAWRVEPIGPDPTVSDSLNKVKQRSARMSKVDKMRNKLSELGLSDADIEAMTSKMIALARKEPEALRKEAELKGELKPTLPIISTDEEREARKAEKKRLDEEDKALAKAEKEAKEKELASVHNDRDEKLILTEDKPENKAVVQAQEMPKIEPISGNLDLSKLKFT